MSVEYQKAYQRNDRKIPNKWLLVLTSVTRVNAHLYFFFVCFNSMAPHLANAQYASRLHQINIEFILIISSLIFIFPLLQTERQRKRRRRHDHKCTKQWLDENIKKKKHCFSFGFTCNFSYLLHFISVDSPFGLPIFDHRRLLPWHLISAPYEPQSTNIRYGDANKKKINWSRGVSFQEQFINVRLQWHPVVFKLNVLRAYVHWFAHWPRVSRQGAHRCWHFGCLTQTRIASHNKLRTYDGAFPENWSPSHTHIVRSADWIKKNYGQCCLFWLWSDGVPWHSRVRQCSRHAFSLFRLSFIYV